MYLFNYTLINYNIKQSIHFINILIKLQIIIILYNCVYNKICK